MNVPVITLSIVALSGIFAESAILENLMSLSKRVKTDDTSLNATWGGNEGPKAIVTEDFDQDGHADFATANLDGSLSIVYGLGNGLFGDPVFISLGARTLRSLSTGDLNGDTFLDFATTDPVSGNLLLILSNGSRSYDPPDSQAQWSGVRTVTTGHFNDDTHLDLALAGPHSTSEGENLTGLRFLFGDGTGNFPTHDDVVNPLPFQKESSLKPVFNLIPFRRVGSQLHSLAICHAESPEVWTLHPGEGTMGYFPSPNPLLTKDRILPISMKIGGIQSPTAQDLVLVSKDGNQLLIYPDNHPTAVGINPWRRSTPVEIPIPGAPRSVEIADMNNDGRNDLAVVLRNFDRMVIYENRETGFESISEVPTGASPREVVATEWNGDNLPDLLVMNRRSQDVNLFSSDQHLGGIGVSNQIYPVDGTVSKLTVRDLNNDGRDDVMQLHVSSNEFSVRFSDQDGFLGEPVYYPTGINPISFLAKDFNRDGSVDIAIANLGIDHLSSTLDIRYGNGDGTFQERSIISNSEGRMFAIESADFDGDSISDLIVGYFDCRIVVYRGLANGSFERRFVHPFTYESRVMVSGDFDQDGDIDLAGSGIGGDLIILVNNGDFMSDTIAQRFSYQYGGNNWGSVRLRVTDHDHNGDPDLQIVAPDGIFTYLGAEGTTFVKDDSASGPLKNTPESVAFLDINGDDVEDIVFSSDRSSSLSMYQGLADGGFQFLELIDVPSANYIATGDLDGDGDLDLVGTGSSLWTVLCNSPANGQTQRQLINSSNRPGLSHPVINEILSSNNDIPIPGVISGSPDAIEIFYGGSDPLSLENGSIRLQTADETLVYSIKETADLTENSRLVFICNEDTQPYHTGFNLPKEGGTLSLLDSDDQILDSVMFPALETNTSYARYQDGFTSFAVNVSPDIGRENLDNGVVDPDMNFESFQRDPLNPDRPLRVLVTAQDDVGVFTLTMNYRRLDTPGLEEQSLLLFDDGQHGDGAFGDGLFANTLPDDLPSEALIEFFFTAVDLLGEQSSKPGSSTFGALDEPTGHHIIRLGQSGPSLPLQISEVVSKNKSGLTEENGKTVDWVELRNTSDSPIPLAGIELASDLFAETADTYHFPPDTILQPGQYYIVFADNDPEDSPLHAPFRIDSDGDRLALLTRDNDGVSTIIDIREIPALRHDTSWFHLGTSGQSIVGSPTPGQPNVSDRLTLIPSGEEYFVVFPTQHGIPYSLFSSPDFSDVNSFSVLDGTGNNIEQVFSASFNDKQFYWLETPDE